MLEKYTVFSVRLLEIAKGTDNPHQFSIYSRPYIALSPIDSQLKGVLAKKEVQNDEVYDCCLE